MKDPQSLYGQTQLPRRYNILPGGEIHTRQFSKSIGRSASMGEENAETPQSRQTHDIAEHEGKARQDEAIYADGANVIVDLDTIPQLAQKLLHYGALTATRDVEIHRGELGIVARLKEHGSLKSQLPRPFNLESIETSGNVPGKHIHINLTSDKAIQDRLRKS